MDEVNDWEPSALDFQFMHQQIRMLKDGGQWVVPGTRSIFTFYHSMKKYKFMGDRDLETNQRTFKLLEIIGWSEIISI